MTKVMKYIFSNLMPNTQKIYVAFILIYQFLSERMKIEKIEKLVANFHVKTDNKKFKTSFKPRDSV